MPDEQQSSDETVVLSDQAGHYYVFSREAVLNARVPDDQQAALEELIDNHDVSGHSAGRLLGFNQLVFVRSFPTTLFMSQLRLAR